MIVAKIIMQQLWSLNLNWDENIPQKLCCKWKTYQLLLSQLGNFKIPRWITESASLEEITIYGFSDASEVTRV